MLVYIVAIYLDKKKKNNKRVFKVHYTLHATMKIKSVRSELLLNSFALSTGFALEFQKSFCLQLDPYGTKSDQKGEEAPLPSELQVRKFKPYLMHHAITEDWSFGIKFRLFNAFQVRLHTPF